MGARRPSVRRERKAEGGRGRRGKRRKKREGKGGGRESGSAATRPEGTAQRPVPAGRPAPTERPRWGWGSRCQEPDVHVHVTSASRASRAAAGRGAAPRREPRVPACLLTRLLEETGGSRNAWRFLPVLAPPPFSCSPAAAGRLSAQGPLCPRLPRKKLANTCVHIRVHDVCRHTMEANTRETVLFLCPEV